MDSSSEKYSPVFILSGLTLDFSFIEEIKTSISARDTKLFCHKCLEVFKFRAVQIVARVFHSSLSRVETRSIMKNLPNSFSYVYIGGEEDVLSL